MSVPTQPKNLLRKHLVFKSGTIRESARKLELSYDRLLNILSGRIIPKKEEIEILANYLGIEAAHLGL